MLQEVSRMSKREKILKELERISQVIQVPFYWLDLNQRYLGINEFGIKTIGATSYEKDFYNKTPCDLFPKEMADNIIRHHKDVIKTEKIFFAEESIKRLGTKEIRYYDAVIAPLRDEDGNIIGTIGTSIDITTKKEEAERLKKSKVFKHLQEIASIIPLNLYWLDINNIILGVNERALQAVGVASRTNIIGKTVYDLYPKEMADTITAHHQEVIRTGKILTAEEYIRDVTSGKIKYFNAIMAPLRDDDGNIIGTIGASVDITTEKNEAEQLKKSKVLEHLERVAQALPTPFYWLGLNQEYLGVNLLTVKAAGSISYDKDFAGKTPYDLYPKEMAEGIVAHHKKVIHTGQPISAEETIRVLTTREIKYFNATIAPLRDDDGNIIGTIGTSIDITAEKEAELLRLENEINKNLIQEQEKFMKIANQVAHDIRSPLASLLMIVKSCTEIPESDRIALREAAIGIGDIANHLLNQYQKNDANTVSETEERQPALVSAVLLQLLTDKKYQYQDLPIRFDHDFLQKAHFAFIKIDPSSFKRMISNLINNAVDAFDGTEGKVKVKLNASNEWIKILIQDNGKGISPELIDKIIHNVPVTAGKKTGHGIGLTQVCETLQLNQGEMTIDSKQGKGTAITLTFPRIEAPNWIAEEIKLGRSDLVVILDDDSSIHGAWRAHFDPILKEAPDIQLKHFIAGKEALEFLNALPAEQKEKVFLLTDYELLKQELNGLDVVEKTQIQHSILVTSHYANPLVRDQAAKTSTKILPKQLASEIPIKIAEAIQSENQRDMFEQADLIIVDDNENFIRNLVLFIFNDKLVDEYYDPHHFLANVAKYSKDIKIYLDNNFATSSLKGLEIAKQLHEQGYTRLYLLSGDNLKKDEIPAYLTVIRKDDIDNIKTL